MKTRRNSKRVGFSLMEIMVVLAVFFMIAAMAVPFLQRSFSGQRLKTAADVVRARFSEARVRAIQSGDVYGFFYAPNSDQYFIAPMTLGFRSIMNGEQLTVRQDQLPKDILFSAGETIEDNRSIQESENSDFNSGNMRPILFYPDGTSQDATIVLQNKTGAVVQINLRGLTGVSNSSTIMSPEVIQ